MFKIGGDPWLTGDYVAKGNAFQFIYTAIFVPLQSTMFSLLAFFVASASYRHSVQKQKKQHFACFCVHNFTWQNVRWQFPYAVASGIIGIFEDPEPLHLDHVIPKPRRTTRHYYRDCLRDHLNFIKINFRD